MIIRILFSLLLFFCIFDPADSIFGLKVPVFVLLMGYSIVTRRFSFDNKRLFNYVLLFSIVVPVFSYLIGFLTNMDNYDTPNLFAAIKPFLFLFIAFTFHNDWSLQKSIIKIFAYELLLLAVVSIFILVISILEIVPFELLYEFGDMHTLYSIGERTYGPFVINRIYFHTAPMLVFALCYFINSYFEEKKLNGLLFSFVISAALLFSGTRNDMIMGVLPYFIFAFVYGSKNVRMGIIILYVLVLAFLLSQEFVMALFDKTEESNDTKLGFLEDYSKAFSNYRTLFLGDGLDSYFFVKERGRVNITELTYFELLRRFGFLGSLVYLYLMIKPAIGLCKNREFLWLGTAYSLYLIMITFNPFFFSSNGMIILSIVTVVFFSYPERVYYSQQKVY